MKTRGFLLTLFLILYSINSAFFLLIALFIPSEVGFITGMVITGFAIANVAVVVGLWMWKKWALYTGLAYTLMQVFYQFTAGGGDLFGVVNLIITGLFLYALVSHWSAFT